METRAVVFRSMLSEEIADVRELAEAVLLFGAGAIFSDWSGYARDTGTLTPPVSWKVIGFRGPSLGYPEFKDA